MTPTELLYLVSSAALIAVGLAMVAVAVRAYADTRRTAMVHLSVGFGLIVCATLVTAVGAFASDFADPAGLLALDAIGTTLGLGFVVNSVVGE